MVDNNSIIESDLDDDEDYTPFQFITQEHFLRKIIKNKIQL